MTASIVCVRPQASINRRRRLVQILALLRSGVIPPESSKRQAHEIARRFHISTSRALEDLAYVRSHDVIDLVGHEADPVRRTKDKP